MMDYGTLATLASSARDPGAGKPIANNTRLYLRGDELVIRLHATDILTYHADGSVAYYAGGWRTVTTKDRFNHYGPDGYRVYSDRGQWRLYGPGPWDARPSWPYADGITVHADGAVTGAGEDTAREMAKLRRRASGYARDYIAALYAGEVGPPTGGDCWLCLLVDEKSGRPWGAGDPSHMVAHIDEAYYVSSLIVNAARELGASLAARETIRALQAGELGGGWAGIVREQLTRMVRRYVIRSLGMQA